MNPFIKAALAAIGYSAIAVPLCMLANLNLNYASNFNFATGVALYVFLGLVTLYLLPTAFKLAREAYTHFVARLHPPTSVLALVALLLFGACTRIDAGNVGIEVDLAGNQRGVQDLPLKTGWIFHSPVGVQIFEYPTFMQTAVWTKNPGEGNPTNEEISFNTKEGLVMTADISLSYQLVPEKVPAFYVKFRSDDLKTFTHGFLRNIARDKFSDVAGGYPVEDLYGTQKEKFIAEVKARINKEVEAIGVRVEQFGFIGAPRPPQNVVDAINAKIGATQKAMQIENELRQAEGEAKKIVAAAQGAADSRVRAAEGEAKAKIAVAEAEAKANDMIAKSITPDVIAWRQLELQNQAILKWNGMRPTVESGGGGLILQLPAVGGSK